MKSITGFLGLLVVLYSSLRCSALTKTVTISMHCSLFMFWYFYSCKYRIQTCKLLNKLTSPNQWIWIDAFIVWILYPSHTVSTSNNTVTFIQAAVANFTNTSGFLNNCSPKFKNNFICSLNLSSIILQYQTVNTTCSNWNAAQYTNCMSANATGCTNYTVRWY